MDASVAQNRGAIVDELQQRIVDLNAAGAPVPQQWTDILTQVADTADPDVIQQAQTFLSTLPPMELKTAETSWATFQAFSQPALDSLTLQYVRAQITGDDTTALADQIKSISAIRDSSGTPAEALSKLSDIQKAQQVSVDTVPVSGVRNVAG